MITYIFQKYNFPPQALLSIHFSLNFTLTSTLIQTIWTMSDHDLYILGETIMDIMIVSGLMGWVIFQYDISSVTKEI